MSAVAVGPRPDELEVSSGPTGRISCDFAGTERWETLPGDIIYSIRKDVLKTGYTEQMRQVGSRGRLRGNSPT